MPTFTLDGYNSYSGCDIIVTASLPLINGQAVGKYYTLGSIQTLSISTHQDKRPVRSLGVINAKDYVMGPRTIAGSMVFAVFNKHFATEIMNDLGATQNSVILPDEIPALDITISFANEYGKKSRMAIYGLKFINEGQVMSINDLYTENTYQFVALGLEPLNAEDGEAQGSNKDPGKNTDIITPEDYNDESGRTPEKNKDFNSNSGSNVSDKIKNNQALNSDKLMNDNMIIEGADSILLEVSVQDAINIDDLGMVSCTTSPTVNSGQVNIYKGKSKKDTPDYIIAVTDVSDVYNASIPVGEYVVQYIDNTTGQFSNIVSFEISIANPDDSTQEVIEAVPVIEKTTDHSITLANNYSLFDTINYFKKGGVGNSMPLDKKSYVIDNLEPDTEYYIYFSNSKDSKRSNTVSIKTFEFNKTEGDYLEDYIKTNSNILVNDPDEVISTVQDLQGKIPDEQVKNRDVFIDADEINTTPKIISQNQFDNYKTPIDAILTLPDSAIKQELLIFAKKLTNQLISTYNSSNNEHITSYEQETPFSTEIRIKDYDKAIVYEYRNNKTFLLDSFICLFDSFYGIPNRHYSIYGIDLKNNVQSVKKDFVICRNTYIEKLNPYLKTNQYLNLDTDNNKLKYNTYDHDTVLAMTIKENCYCDLDVLAPPYIYIEENGEVYADVKYTFANIKNTYYLVCAELYESLDHTPFRKIKFDTFTHTINLNNHYLGLLKGKKYLFWIELEDGMKISKPFLFEYVEDEDTQLKEIYKKELRSKVNILKKDMLYKYSGNFMLEELFSYVYDSICQEKDFNETIELELINYSKSSIYEMNTFDMLFELKKITHNYNQMKILPDIVIDKKNRVIQFEKIKNHYLCGVNYSDGEINRIFDDNNIVHYGDTGYTLVFLMNENMIYKSGFVLIDCVSNTYLVTNDLFDHITEGVI